MATLIDSSDPQPSDLDGQHPQVWIRRVFQRVLTDSFYAVSAFPIALTGFVFSVVVLALGLGLSVVVVGVPLLGGAVWIARSFAEFERRRLRALSSRLAPTPSYLQGSQGDGFWRRAVTPLLDPQAWRDVAWSLLGVFSGTAASALTLVWWVAAIGGLTFWSWQPFISVEAGTVTLASVIGLGQGRLQESLVNLLIGAIALVTLPLVVRFAAAIHATLAAALLVGVPLGTSDGEAS